VKEDRRQVLKILQELSDGIDPDGSELSIILAAGHGKRIKSDKSKMLHEIWGKPSVWRVCDAARKGLSSQNQIVVVGIKAIDVARALGKCRNRVFVYQEEQRGTGDAVKVALAHRSLHSYTGDVYILPGDMGLLTEGTVKRFRKNFQAKSCDMLVLTGIFEGKIEDNYYGRIIKPKAEENRIVVIREYRDILAMRRDESYTLRFQGMNVSLSKEDLLNLREFNTGVYAFKTGPLKKYINSITADNVQGEIYITDLIKIFNDHGLCVQSFPVENNDYVVAFNVKSVLKQMEVTFRSMVYDKLKDLVTIDDADDFYIAEETVERIIDMDNKTGALDIRIGKGASIGKDIHFGQGLEVNKNAQLSGNVRIGKNVSIGENVVISTFPGQCIEIGDRTRIFSGNILKGNVKLGRNAQVESGVRITGSDEWPVVIGNNVLIKGMTYIFGSVIEDDLLIVHSIVEKQYVERVVKKSGEIQPIKYILPHPEGLDSIRNLKTDTDYEDC